MFDWAPTQDCTDRVTVLAPWAFAKGEACSVMSAAPQPVSSIRAEAPATVEVVRTRSPMSGSLLRAAPGRLGDPVEHQAEADDGGARDQAGGQIPLGEAEH